MALTILTINAGSSSIKVSLFRFNQGETMLAIGQIDRIGLKSSSFELADGNGNWLVNEKAALANHDEAYKKLFGWLAESGYDLDGVGHRIVHGGPNYRSHQPITPDLLEELHRVVSYSPLHLPPEILGIEYVEKFFPNAPQVACFDTAFHQMLPNVAKYYAIPRRFSEEGIFRYGFHGISYEYIMEELQEIRKGKTIICHLGNGASMAAIKNSRCIDTTMGFTPAEGLVMGTRSGDVDPGLIIFLAAHKKMNADDLRNMINHESGLKGLSELGSDVQDLLEAEASNNKAKEALDIFCYRAKKYIGALAAALGGLNTLVFTAGIGENSPEIRQRICKGLEFLGIELDKKANRENREKISKKSGPVNVQVLQTNEELMIARHTMNIVVYGQGASYELRRK